MVERGPLTSDAALWPLLAAGALSLLIVAGVLLWRLYQRRRRNVDRRLREACPGVLANFVIPDGNGEEIQVQYALLSGRGILVIDIKDVEGHVFGSEAMQDWTVIADDRRFTFPNPQPGLWDRVAAVKRLTPEAPVTGFVAFAGRARFTKGQPKSVTLLEPLLQELEKEAAASRSAVDGYLTAWERLRQAAIAARMDHLLSVRSR
ncbi:MAG: nuclease-related domain-containing protein [Gammaproteobacteria bacterium]|nr:nuclease-related domain-containing protein [Gammaproteobacteria bacterium]